MRASLALTEADILDQVVAPHVGGFPADAARSILSLRFNRETQQVIRQLLRKNNRGSITGEERVALEKYLRVGQFLDLLHTKARLSLQAQGTSA